MRPEFTVSDEEARFDAVRRRIGIVLAPLVFVLVLMLPHGGLSPEAHRLAAVVVSTVILWVTEAIPLAAAALLGPALAVMLGVSTADAAFAPFASPLIFLFLGGFLLAEGLSTQGFDRRAALWLMARPFVAGSPSRATAAVVVTAYGFSMWISNTATTAMMIPIALGLHATMTRALPEGGDARARLDRYAGGMCLFVAYGASIGGVATPIGTGPNLIAMAFLEQTLQVRIDFLHWMTFALPTSLGFLLVLLAVGRKAFPPPVEHIAGLTHEVERQLRSLGPLTIGERRAVFVFALAIAGWIGPSMLGFALGRDHPWTSWAANGLHEGVVAIVCASLLFALPSGHGNQRLLSWDRAHSIDWGTLLLLGGGIALGKLMFDTGLARALGESVLGATGPLARHPAGLLAAATVLVLFLTEITSNTASTSMMLPVVVGIAQAGGLDAVPTAVCITFAASFAFMLPVSTPPNAMAYGTGLIRIDAMIRVGFRLDMLGLVLLLAVGLGLIPWLL